MVTISKTDLARRTREMLDKTREGETLVIESYGEEVAVLLEPFRYRILQALAILATSDSSKDHLATTLREYLDGTISLGRAAEQLNVSRFALMEHFTALRIPIYMGPETVASAHQDVENARQQNRS